MTETSKFADPGELIRAARRCLAQTQAQFATTMGSRQSLISKYERNLVDPPSVLIMRCMNIVSPSEEHQVTEDSLVQMVRDRLTGAEHAAARKAIAAVIAGIG